MTEHLSRPPYKLYTRKSDRKALILAVVLSVAVILALWGICSKAMGAEVIDMHAIMLIESGGNPYAINYETECYGLYQISKICLKDINQIKKGWYSVDDLLNPKINTYIAHWYFFERLPQLLKHYKIPITEITLIASYNWGIGNVVKWYKKGAHLMEFPSETINYIKKYKKLAKR